MNIYEKIAAIMQDVQYLCKDDKVEFGSTKYKALSEEKVTSIMRAEMVKHKLVVFPIAQNASRNGQITHVDVIYRIVNVENPDEFIDVASCGDGADSQDKGSGKAMTYAFKYMWLRVFAIPTGEDPDKVSSEELDAIAAMPKIVCEKCGVELKPFKDKNGKLWDAEMQATMSRKRYGGALCKACMKEAEKTKKEVEKCLS